MKDLALDAALEEIKAVLKKHDVAGFVALAGQNIGDWTFQMPMWARVTFKVVRPADAPKDQTVIVQPTAHLADTNQFESFLHAVNALGYMMERGLERFRGVLTDVDAQLKAERQAEMDARARAQLEAKQ